MWQASTGNTTPAPGWFDGKTPLRQHIGEEGKQRNHEQGRRPGLGKAGQAESKGRINQPDEGLFRVRSLEAPGAAAVDHGIFFGRIVDIAREVSRGNHPGILKFFPESTGQPERFVRPIRKTRRWGQKSVIRVSVDPIERAGLPCGARASAYRKLFPEGCVVPTHTDRFVFLGGK